MTFYVRKYWTSCRDTCYVIPHLLRNETLAEEETLPVAFFFQGKRNIKMLMCILAARIFLVLFTSRKGTLGENIEAHILVDVRFNPVQLA